MTTMITEVYDAFLAANVPPDKAKAAAEAFHKDSHLATKADLAQLEAGLTWRFAVMLVAQVGVLFTIIKLFG